MKEIIAFLFGSSLVVNALLFVPQIIKIWKTKSGKSVSILTFGGFNILQVIGIFYGYTKPDHIIMWGMVASLIACGSITLLALVYRNQ